MLRRHTFIQVLAALVVSMGGFAIGNVLGSDPLMKIALLSLNYPQLTQKQLNWQYILTLLGVEAMLIPLPRIMDRFGRKLTIIVTSFCLFWAWIFASFTNTYHLRLISALLIGAFTGPFSVASPIYMAEVVDADIRGTLGTCFELFILMGDTYAVLFGMFHRYRSLAMACIPVPVCIIIGISYIPESPRFLMTKDTSIHIIEYALKFFNGAQYDWLEGMQQFMNSVGGEPGYTKLFKNSLSALLNTDNRRTMGSCLMMMLSNELSGRLLFRTYAMKVFFIRESTYDVRVGMILLIGSEIVGNCIAVRTADSFGRKRLLCVSFTIVSLCAFTIGVALFTETLATESGPLMDYVKYGSIVMGELGFASGVGPLSWVIMQEIFAMEVKSTGCSVCMFLKYFIQIIIILSYNHISFIFESYITYVVYGILCCLMILYVVNCLMATAHRTLEEIQMAQRHVTPVASTAEKMSYSSNFE